MPPMPKHVALVTGGTRGLGRAIAVALARIGYTPAVMYRSDESSAETAVALLQSIDGKSTAIAGDVSNAEDVARVVNTVETVVGPIGVLVNNAFRSGRPAKKTHELDVEAWREDVDVNLTGQFLMSRACLAPMLDRGFGRIVFVGSLAERGEPGRVAYSTVKSALSGLAKTIAAEYAKHDITANVVSPGFIDTGAFQRLPEEIRERALKMVPSRRAGEAEEVAELVAYLAGPHGGFVTGQVLAVNGGVR